MTRDEWLSEKIGELERRIEKLEEHSHVPIDVRKVVAEELSKKKCVLYKRPWGTFDGPCNNCGKSLAEHYKK